MSYIYAYYEVEDNNTKGQLLNKIKRTPKYIGKSDLYNQDGIWISEEGYSGAPYDRKCDYGVSIHGNPEFFKSPYYQKGQESRSKSFREWIKSKESHEIDVRVLYESDDSELISFLEFYLIARIGKQKDGGTLLNHKDGGLSQLYDPWEYEELEKNDIQYEFDIKFLRKMVKEKYLIPDCSKETLRKLFKDEFGWFIRAIKGKLLKINENKPLHSIKWTKTEEVIFLREDEEYKPRFQTFDELLKQV